MGKKRKAAELRHDAPPQSERIGKKEGFNHGHGGRKANGIYDSQKIALKFQPRPEWHTAELPTLPSVEDATLPPKSTLEALKNYGYELLEEENSLASINSSQSQSRKFMSTIMTSGTLEDKVSAHTLAVQESPMHGIRALENLIGMSRKKSRNHALMAMAAVKDLLAQGVVLPTDRKLRWFGRQPGLLSALQGKNASWSTGDKLPGDVQEIHLLVWAFEDFLKKSYFELLQILEGWCNDEIVYSRNRAITYVWELLKDKPEQEENLLRLLVNKLGDTERKVASRASYLLLQLQVTHPNMKEVVIKAIESDLLFRPGQSSHARYYAIITLNQTILSTKEQGLARKLLDLYFDLFKTLLHASRDEEEKNSPSKNDGKKMSKKAIKKEKLREDANTAEKELKEKMAAQVLTGVNRAFPFADPDEASFEAQLDTLYRITHSSNFNTSIQALILIQMVSAAKNYTADRFYRTLYESLLDPRLIHSSKQVLYLNLLYRSLKSDINVKRLKAFVKRILQTLTLHEPPFICGALFLVSEIQKLFPSIKAMLSEPELLEDDEEERILDAPEDDSQQESMSLAIKDQNTTSGPIYDPRKRDPLFSNADRSCLWELLPFQAHFHPSVSLFATKLLFSENVSEKPDPNSHTLMHFLDRFIYRNARTKAGASRGSSIMQPLTGATSTDLLIRDRALSRTEIPLNREEFWSKDRENVRADEVFFHQYFNQAGKRKKTKKAEKKKSEAPEDDDSQDDENEEEIWKALVDSRPDIEAEAEDEGFSDMEEFMSDDPDENADEGVDVGLGSEDSDQAAAIEEGDDDDEMELDLAELESADEDALFGSDEDLPSDLDTPLNTNQAEEHIVDSEGKHQKQKKQKLKHLPVFASAEEYARLMGESDDENI